MNTNKQTTYLPNAKEFWKPYPEDFDYCVSNLGNILKIDWNSLSIHKIRMHFDRDGYLRTTLNGKARFTHHIVASAFLGSRNGREVNHKDFDKTNNSIKNLEYVTRLQNLKHQHLHQKANYKVKGEKRTQLLNDIKNKLKSQNKIAKEFGLSLSQIQYLKRQINNCTSN